MNDLEPPASDPDDMIGRVFGAWTVLQRSSHTIASQTCRIWDCLCRCGRTSPVIGGDLLRGHSTRCRTCASADRRPEAHAKLPDGITLTQGELFLARMLAREGLHAIGIIALFARREDAARAKDREERQVPTTKARDQQYKRDYRARIKARKAAGAA